MHVWPLEFSGGTAGLAQHAGVFGGIDCSACTASQYFLSCCSMHAFLSLPHIAVPAAPNLNSGCAMTFVAPHLPQQGAKRLQAELRYLLSAIEAGKLPCVHDLTPVNDNIFKWRVQCSFGSLCSQLHLANDLPPYSSSGYA